MKNNLCLWGFCLLVLFSACEKESIPPVDTDPDDSDSIPEVDSIPPGDTIPFVDYFIRKGQQYADQNPLTPVEYTELRFTVKFDSSAVYTTKDPSNQYDINKLYGFADNASFHQLYSARFGWRWSDNALRLFAYIYNNGTRLSRELGTVQIGAEHKCSIKVAGATYIFSLNAKSDTLARASTTAKGSGYKLYPYFGGDEVAPHDIKISIKEQKAD